MPRRRFLEYAREWLYGEGGYYVKAPVIGKRGDFFTSVSASSFFGGAIANHLVGLIKSGDLAEDSAVVEFGAHRGELLSDIAQFVYTLEPKLLKTLNFTIIEPIEALRKAQEEYIRSGFGDALRLAILPDLSRTRYLSAFVYANELFDAFSFDLYNKGEVAYVENHSLVWQKADAKMASKANRLGIERGEIFDGFERFAWKLSAAFNRCETIIFDYGVFHPRNDFSARIYKEHRVYPLFSVTDLNLFYKNADLTADVPFWHLLDAFRKAGFEAAVKEQNSALLDMGLPDLLRLYEEKAGFEAYRRETGRVRTLLDPLLLGERFKCCRFRR
ncbi:MAG: SAM-dependent methyltransferase [Helicobacteraceae bacterium]|nr:SAM-dependent methyltransferase [Helicobacteraceae bacterium]